MTSMNSPGKRKISTVYSQEPKSDEKRAKDHKSNKATTTTSIQFDWLALPNSTLIKIFKFLDHPLMLSRCSLVCKRWRNAIARDGEAVWQSFCLLKWNMHDVELCGFSSWKIAWKEMNRGNIENLSRAYEVIEDNQKNSQDCMFISYVKPPVLPSFLWNKTQLHSLSLHGNALVVLPTSISCLMNLDFLDLSHNQLTSITPVTALTKLTSLWINNNKLETLPSQITNLQNLYNLIFSFNFIRTLPNCLSALTNLELLHFANNGVESIPHSLSTLTNLRVLDASRNRLHAGSFPPQLSNLTALRNVFLSRNLLETLPINPICSWTRLTVLYLDCNFLSCLPLEFFKQFTNLRTLWLQRNPVVFSEAQFAKMTTITQLELSPAGNFSPSTAPLTNNGDNNNNNDNNNDNPNDSNIASTNVTSVNTVSVYDNNPNPANISANQIVYSNQPITQHNQQSPHPPSTEYLYGTPLQSNSASDESAPE